MATHWTKLDNALVDYHFARKKNQPIFRDGESTRTLFQVESGCVRLQKFCTEGHRCILAFCYPGDLFGLGVQGPDECDAEATTTVRVAQVSAAALDKLLQSDTARGLELVSAAHGRPDLSAEHQLVLSCGQAEQKMAWFLGQVAHNNPVRIDDVVIARLPMSRLDIADYLNITIETVSREIGKLRDKGFIQINSVRDIAIVKPAGLAALTHIDHDRRASFVPDRHACTRSRVA